MARFCLLFGNVQYAPSHVLELYSVVFLGGFLSSFSFLFCFQLFRSLFPFLFPVLFLACLPSFLLSSAVRIHFWMYL